MSASSDSVKGNQNRISRYVWSKVVRSPTHFICRDSKPAAVPHLPAGGNAKIIVNLLEYQCNLLFRKSRYPHGFTSLPNRGRYGKMLALPVQFAGSRSTASIAVGGGAIRRVLLWASGLDIRQTMVFGQFHAKNSRRHVQKSQRLTRCPCQQLYLS
jgi:hypothetical protein